MAPEHPKIKGLFTEYDLATFFSISVQPWHEIIWDHLITSNCFILIVSCYKMQKGAEYEFLWFNISPDKVHMCIVIAERGGGLEMPHNPLIALPQQTPPCHHSVYYTLPEILLMTKQEATCSPYISSISKKSQMGAHDLVSYATLGSRASTELEQKCEKATCICTLTFSEKDRPSAIQLATLLYFIKTVFDALKSLLMSAQEDITNHQGGMWNRVLGPMKPRNVVKVCDKYHAAWAAFAEEAVQKHRAKQQAAEEEKMKAVERAQATEDANARDPVYICPVCTTFE
ncbi:hypothetical protein EDD17DRAFT_1514135 [Pisolithus thermaeus]|nr:hypothetical protein EV401DRAFT_1884058 [Pisolithus croceorrhizus]KAI6148939.1 hypothetical protein EDD17DRAFT_1514135 [Pisolithus thermaeus]